MNFWNKLTDFLKNLFFPEADRCPICGREGGFCQNCRDQLAEQQAGENSAFYYDGIVKDMIHRLKFGDQPYLAKTMAELIAETLTFRGDIITSVPLHPKRKRQRGYNQSEEIGRELSHITGIPYAELLLRLRNTQPQSLIRDTDARKANVCDAFLANEEPIAGKQIILVDDVITTGATIEECRRALLEAGAANITEISFARGKKHGNSENSAQESIGEG